MEDQISCLRTIVRNPIVIGITSGKGGVGKTNITINSAIEIAKKGFKVLIIDGDWSLANVDILFGIVPKYTIKDVLFGEKRLEEIMVDGPYEIKIMPGSSGIEAIEDIDEETRAKFITQFKEIEYNFDFIFIDTGAGISKNVRKFIMAADEVIIVTTPELTALADAYAMIKIIAKNKKVKSIKLLINKVKNNEEATETVERIRAVASKFLGIEIEDFGFVYEDDNVIKAIAEQTPFVITNPEASASICIKSISEKIKELKNKIKKEGESLIDRLISIKPKVVYKKDIIENIMQNANISKSRAKIITNAIIKSIIDGLVDGKEIKLKKFGKFSTRIRRKRKFYNIKNKEIIEVESRKIPIFKPYNGLKKIINA